MADAATARPSATSFISFGHKRIPLISPYIYFAVWFDLIGLIPILGAILGWCFIVFVILWWWICDYKINIGGAKLIGVFLAKIIPVPGPLVWFVWTNYTENVRLTKPVPTESGKIKQSKTERLAAAGGTAYGLSRGKPEEETKPDEGTGKGAEPKQSGARSVGYEQKGQRTGNGVVPPTTQADKSTAYQQKAGSDRIPTQPNPNADLNTAYGGDRNKNMDGMVPPGKAPQSVGYQPR